MSLISVGGHLREVDVFVFDKDGLLFQSKPFWQALALVRAEGLAVHLDERAIGDWLKLMGVAGHAAGGEWVMEDVDVNGMLAVASPDEEMVATASFMAYRLGWPWVRARQAARDIYAAGDEIFGKILKRALVPHQGFPEIFRRLRDCGIPYGIATSDSRERAVMSVDMFDRSGDLAFILSPKDVRRGKPDPEMLHRVSEIMNAPLNRLAMVGDSVVDVQMAKAAGAIGIGIPEHEAVRHAMETYATVIVSSLDEIMIAT